MNYPITLVIISGSKHEMTPIDIAMYVKRVNTLIGVIIIADHHDDEMEKLAYKVGVDDVMINPFNPEILMHKAVNLFRRAYAPANEIFDKRNPSIYNEIFKERFIMDPGVLVDIDSGTIAYKGKRVGTLGPKEAKLFSLLYRHLNTPITHEQIKEIIFSDISASNATLSTLMRRLKRKIAPLKTYDIRNIHGKGYCMELLPL